MKYSFFLLFFCGFTNFGLAQTNTFQQYQNAANQSYTAKNYNQAIKYYQAAISLNPTSAQSFQGLGNCYYALGQYNDALTDYKKSLTLNPGNIQLSQFIDALQSKLGANNTVTSSSSTQPLTGNILDKSSNKMDASNPLIPGKIVWDAGLAYWFSSWDDYQQIWGPSVPTTGTPYGLELDLGLDFNVSPQFSLGAQLQGLARTGAELQIGTSINEQWNTFVIGGALSPKFVLPMNETTNLVSHLELGYYTLLGSAKISGSETASANLGASNIGGLIEEDIEFVFGKRSWALDIGIGYRFLTMSPVTVSNETLNGTPVASHTYLDAYGNDVFFDFSGFRLNTTLRFF
jgi:hypothetical protein